MAEQKEKTFADGFIFKRSESAPEFVIGRLSLKVDEAITFIKKYSKSGWVNLDIKSARSGNYYVELDTFEPKSKKDSAPKEDSKADDDGGLPF